MVKKNAKAGKTTRGNGTKLIAIADAFSLPFALHTDSASPQGVALVKVALGEIVTMGQPKRITKVRAYDSDPLDAPLLPNELKCTPHRHNRKRKTTLDGRPASVSAALKN